MTQYLLAAEADKIQDLIFRSSRLREVIGGSQLLSRFCKEAPQKLAPPGTQIIVNDGGSFRLLFDSKEDAETFKERLAEAYRLATGGTLTVAEPVPVNGDFKKAAEQADRALREAKQHRTGFVTTPHLPHMAFCASCGVELATEHRYRPGENQGQYLCEHCRAKRNESDHASATTPGAFLTDFFKTVVGDSWPNYHWPGKKKKDDQDEREPDPPMDVARFDPRNYVAYIVADGNSMGEIFGRCDKDQLKTLSNSLRSTLYASLAEPAKLLLERTEDKDEQKRTHLSQFLPILPLIAGGDDLFLLLPAPWALDFAQRFAKAYEEHMGQLLEGQKIRADTDPTVAVAVIICKAKYPYYLAHQRGEELLKQAKQTTKRWAVESGKTPRSIVTFEVILGNRLGGAEWSGNYRPTLGPYWVKSDVEGWGLDINHLIEQRYKLRGLPRRRLAQLRAHFDTLTGIASKDDFEQWSKQLKQLLERFPKAQRDIVEQALAALGGQDFYFVERTTDRDSWYGHALPDLLNVWDFAFSLGCPRVKYEEYSDESETNLPDCFKE